MSSPRQNLLYALAIALAFHAALAVALAFYTSHTPAPDELAKFDLTGVDLSFAEAVEETIVTVASAPSLHAETPPPPPPLRRAQASGAQSAPSGVLSPSRHDAILPMPTEPFEKITVDSKREDTKHETRDEKPPMAEAASTPSQQASAPRQARVDAPPKPCQAIRPDYPRESRLRGEYGDVALELHVAADGSVSDVHVIRSSGYPLLDKAALKAARYARFTPAKAGGESVAATIRLTLSFRLK